ncbi:YgcG family protein [Marinoscillum sp. 108]|uniref:TPM domain-containing protein n=1 Tax=Marinoscillum sp. 108 TaxID=2653151 RepID=UPI0013585C42|nr:TPM domain-containing protein [Marinoscillum sp. 108]
MRNFQYFLLLTLLTTFGCNSQSQKSTPQRTTYSNVPELYARVNDYADILSDDEEANLNQLLKSLEDSIGSQLVILSIVSLDERTIEEYSIDVADNWRIGRANYNDGIIITLAMKDRMIRIEVGYGLELIIRDEIAKKIIDSTMIPEFRTGNFNAGLTKASEKIINLIYSNPELVGKKWEPNNNGK